MVKKRPSPKPQRDEKVPVQIRFDPELHQSLTKAAESLDISINQLVNAVLWGTIPRLILGEAVIKTIDGRGFVSSARRRKCAFFGKGGSYKGSPEEQHFRESAGQPLEVEEYGECWFGVDFSERGVVNRRH